MAAGVKAAWKSAQAQTEPPQTDPSPFHDTFAAPRNNSAFFASSLAILLSFSQQKGIFKNVFGDGITQNSSFKFWRLDAKTPSEPMEFARVYVCVPLEKLNQTGSIKTDKSSAFPVCCSGEPAASGACLGSGRSRRGSAPHPGAPRTSPPSAGWAPWNVPASPECLLFTPHLLLDASSRFLGLAQRFRVCYKYPAFCKDSRNFTFPSSSCRYV